MIWRIDRVQGIILVDSSTSEILDGSVSSPHGGARLRVAPIHSGFEDFRTPISFSSFQSARPQRCDLSGRRGSLLDHTLACMAEDHHLFRQTAPTPLSLAYYPLKVALAEWELYSQVVSRFLKHYEYSLNDARIRAGEDDIMGLQKWRHRIIQTQFKLRSFKAFISYHSTPSSNRTEWDMVQRDLDNLLLKLSRYGKSLERVIPTAASMALLSHYRRSATEATVIRRLTCVALVFVPLSWVAALFSMTNDFAPGQPRFWVYFVVSAPFCLTTVLGTIMILNYGNMDIFQIKWDWMLILGGLCRRLGL